MEENNKVETEEVVEPATTEEKTEPTPVEEKKTEENQLPDLGEPIEVTGKLPPIEAVAAETSTSEIKDKKSNKGLKITLIVLITLAVLTAAGVGCYFAFFKDKTSSGNDKGDTKTIKNKSAEVFSTYKLSGNGLEDFDLAFLKMANSNKNSVYSPLSIKYALQMLSEGADGNTKKEIDSTIGAYKTKKYTNSQNMSFANAMFIKNSIKDNINPKYTNKLQDKYNAEVILDDFSNANTMNKWVSDKTFNLVNNLLTDEKVQSLDYILVNALAIDMEWNKLIQAACTPSSQDIYYVNYNHEKYHDFIGTICGDGGFSSINFDGKDNIKGLEIGASINNYDIVKTLGEDKIRKTVGDEYKKWLETEEGKDMAKSGSYYDTDVNKYLDGYISEINKNYKQVDVSTDFKFYTDDNVTVFAKDLKEYNGTALQYVGIMPKKDKLSDFVKNTSAKDLNKLIDNLKDVKLENFEEGKVTRIVGTIPVFSYEYEMNLTEELPKVGIKDVFDKDKADLSNLLKNSKGAYIKDASHKANIEFSNEGIKAAAATQEGGGGSTTAGFDYFFDVPVKIIDLTFDKPYMYIIRDKVDGEVWFVGSVYEPTVNTVQGMKTTRNKIDK